MKRHLAIATVCSSFLLPPSSFASDAVIERPTDETPIPIEKAPSAPPRPAPKELGEEPGMDVSSVPRRVIQQLKDYNWEQNVNIRIGNFTILGYRDATNTTDRMLFRFLTREEHAEKRVMNSKTSLLHTPKRKPSEPSECCGLTQPSSARLDAPKESTTRRVKPRRRRLRQAAALHDTQ